MRGRASDGWRHCKAKSRYGYGARGQLDGGQQRTVVPAVVPAVVGHHHRQPVRPYQWLESERSVAAI